MTQREPDTLTIMRPYSESEFFEKLQQDIALTEDSEHTVSLHTMSLEPEEPYTKRILTELSRAAMRGVNTTFVTDAYTLLYPHRIARLVAFQPYPSDKAGLIRRQEALDRLQEAGVKVGVVNETDKMLANITRGRSHMKIGVVNNTILLGGPNLHETERVDMAVGFTHEKTARWLHRLIGTLAISGATSEALGTSDIERYIDTDTKILIDVGEPCQSIIMDEAITIIDDTEEHLLLGSPFLPTGVIMQHLRTAHQKNVTIEAFYDRARGTFALAQYCLRILHSLQAPQGYHAQPIPSDLPPLHAKIIASEKAAMITSHNFTPLTVRMGMTEIGLVRHKPSFATAVKNLLYEQLHLLPSIETNV